MPLHSYNKFIMLSLLDDASEDLREKKEISVLILQVTKYFILKSEKHPDMLGFCSQVFLNIVSHQCPWNQQKKRISKPLGLIIDLIRGKITCNSM